MSDLIVAPEIRDLDELAAALAGWMAVRLPGASGLRVTNLDYPRGAGMSHETILFDAEWREGGEPRTLGCVVRIKPSKHTVFPDNLFEEQFRIMRLLNEKSHVRVAKVLWLEPDPALLGQPFFVMEKKRGRVPVSWPPYAQTGWVAEATPAQRRRLWEGAVRQLAEIQRVPVAEVRFLEGPAHAREGLAQEWDKYVRFVDWLEEVEPQPILRAALDRLQSLWPQNQPEGLVWGDARIGNMMFDDNFDVVTVMDWEQPSLGGALHDLAWFCVLSDTMHGPSAQRGGYLEGMGSHDETVALWEDVCGKSAAGLDWYKDFTHFKMSCTGVRLKHLRGSAMMDEETMRKRLKLD